MAFFKDALMEGASAAVSEETKEIIAAKAKQVIQKVFENEVTKEKLQELEEMQQEYLRNCYKKNRYMNTIVLRGQKKTIDELYIPLILTSKENMNYYIDENGMDIFKENDKILIVDNAGMGKSTIVKYFTMLNFQNMDRMPIVIELRNLKEVNSIEEYIQKEMNSIHREFPLQYVKDLLNGGNFIICFDGFDEVAESERENVIKMINNFVAKANDNIFVLTSRKDSALASFGEFKEFHIQRLTEEKAYQLIEKYSKADEYIDSETDEYKNNLIVGQELINELKKDIKNNIFILKEFLDNPLMVSLLYKTYSHDENIPDKKYLFYNQVYKVLYEEHDLAKGGYHHVKKSDLDIKEMKVVLSYLGWYFVKKEIVECTENKLIDIIEIVLEKAFTENKINKKIKAIDFLKDILQGIPLFILKEGDNCMWIHKSFSEYFAAYYICNKKRKKQIEIINKILLEKENIEYYENILDFCFDMSKDIKNAIIYSTAVRFIIYYTSSYQDDYFKQFDENLIKLKKGFEFWYEAIRLNIKDNEINEITIFERRPHITILRLLSKKDIDIFSYPLYHIDDSNYKTVTKNLIKIIKETKVFVCQDKKDSIINSKEYIEYFIGNLKTFPSIAINEQMIDYDKCVAMKKSIEEYWARQKEDDDMFD